MNLLSWLSGVLRGAGSQSLEDIGVRELTKQDELAEVYQAAANGRVFVFKHSTTCPISASAHRRVADYLADKGEQGSTWFLVKVIESRPLSNAIAETYGVRHQSPQLLMIEGDTAVWDASHGAITAGAIEAAIAEA
jgi:bacillithiol system protein YtxJ